MIQFSKLVLNFGYWKLFGNWDLEIGNFNELFKL